MPEVTEQPYRSQARRHEQKFFYKYVTANVAKVILATRRLRWSSPILFNDPFDVTQELRLNFNAAELNAAIGEEWANLLEDPDPTYAPSRPLGKLFAGILNTLREKPDLRHQMAQECRRDPGVTTTGQIEAFDELKQVWRVLVPQLRVLCLSEVNDVTSMWLHYTDRYRGAVLQFEAVDHLDSVFLGARPVTYQNAPPAISTKQAWARCLLEMGEKKFEDLVTEYQYVKTIDWAYEREWRLASLGLGPELFTDYGFHPRELTGVYLGTDCSKEDEVEILALLSHGLDHVRAHKARRDGAEARFMFDRI